MSSAAENPKSPHTKVDAGASGKSASDEKLGMILGLTSAVAYSATNLALRQLSDSSDDLGWDIWVSAMKAIPTLVVSVVLLILRGSHQGPLYPSFKAFGVLVIAALVMQFGGNLCFQIALGNIGLAITVPFVFAMIIFSGAFFGRVWTGDTVSAKTLISIAIMTASVITLSYAASQRESETTSKTDSMTAISEASETIENNVTVDLETQWTSATFVQFGILMAVVSGLSYGVNGIVIRGLSQNRISVPAMTIIYSAVGFTCLSCLGVSLLGLQRLQQVTGYEWFMMLVAGTLNAAAFFSITNSLKRLDISRVNVINASQNAMCAIGAFLVFAEPMSALTITGIVLSILGLGILDRR